MFEELKHEELKWKGDRKCLASQKVWLINVGNEVGWNVTDTLIFLPWGFAVYIFIYALMLFFRKPIFKPYAQSTMLCNMECHIA